MIQPASTTGHPDEATQAGIDAPVFDHLSLVTVMEENLLQHGDTYRGVGWTKRQEYADLRYQVMLEGIRAEWPRPLTLLDFGCGASHLYEHIQSRGHAGLQYSGLDLSSRYLALCRDKFPDVTYFDVDLLDPDARLPEFDFIVLNGIFHNRTGNTPEAAWLYCQRLLTRIAGLARKGFAFNVMSKHVEWEREDLFHVPIGALTDFIANNISRNFIVRHDYGLYEYSVYVYREAAGEPV
jgi:SAM-dependent methyltransferase